MVVAEIYKQADGLTLGFSVDGHAGGGNPGFNIHCAGVSSLSQAAFLCIRDHLKRDFDWDAAHGRLMLRLKTPLKKLSSLLGNITIRFPPRLRENWKNVITYPLKY